MKYNQDGFLEIEAGQLATAIESEYHFFKNGELIEFVGYDIVEEDGTKIYIFKSTNYNEDGTKQEQYLSEEEFKLV